MEKLSNPESSLTTLLLDADVLINWLAREEDPLNLWEAPHKIMTMIEEKTIQGATTLIGIMEVRFVLRRKKEFSEIRIKTALNKVMNFLNIIIPDEVNVITSNELQTDHVSLSPLDSILLAVAMSAENAVLLSRDKDLIKVAKNFIPALTPEDFLAKIKV